MHCWGTLALRRLGGGAVGDGDWELGGNCGRKELGAALGQAEGLVDGSSAGVLDNRARGDMAG